MELRIFTEPQQGATYDELLAMARTAEECGYGGFFRSDHYLKMGDVSGLPGPTDAWITLAGLARETERIRLGTLLTAATFRLPGPLAVAVAGVDAMSGGRVELGLGAGWFEDEHEVYGIGFPAVGERFDRLEEQLAIITGLWETPVGELFEFSGRQYQLKPGPALPKPVQQPRPPIIIGGHGARRTPALAARYADEFNVAFSPLDVVERQYHLVDEACRAIGREADSVRRSAALVLCCGSDEAEVERRASKIGRTADELRRDGAAGTPTEVVDTLRAYGGIGATRIYLQVLDLADLDHVRLVADEVLPAVI
jgi:F420-dependent oxidoreductase-like protein